MIAIKDMDSEMLVKMQVQHNGLQDVSQADPHGLGFVIAQETLNHCERAADALECKKSYKDNYYDYVEVVR